MEHAGGQEGLVFAGTDLCAHQFGARGQDAGVLLVQVHAGHGRHIIDVVIVPVDTNGVGAILPFRE